MHNRGFFSQAVWELATSIPPGRVTTYGILARRAGGGAQAARSITGILSKAPNQSAIPYHRIVYSGGRVWFGSDEARRRKLYAKEGIGIDARGYVRDFDEIVWRFE